MLESLFPGYGGGYRQNRWLDMIVRGLPAGNVMGIEVRLHVLLLLLLAWHAGSGLFGMLNGDFGFAEFFLLYVFADLVIFGSVFLHELGHCYGAYVVKGRASSILLWPLGGVAEVEGANKSPAAEVLVTLLGPAVNLLIAIPAHLLHYAILYAFEPNGPVVFVASALWIVYLINYFLFFFNMLLPIFPMDASRVLRGLLSMRMRPRMATIRVTTIGMWVSGAGIFFQLFNPRLLEAVVGSSGGILSFIFIFGFMACMQERVRARFSPGPMYDSEVSYGGNTTFTFTRDHWRPMSFKEFAKYVFGGGARMVGNLAGMAGASKVFKKSPRNKARVVEIKRAAAAEAEEPLTPKARYFRRLRSLEDDLKEAIKSENFQRAQKIKDKIKALKSEAGEWRE